MMKKQQGFSLIELVITVSILGIMAGVLAPVFTMPDDSTISYVLNNNELIRTIGSDNWTLARNISYLNFTVDGRHVTMDITSSPEGRWGISENKNYQICLRPVSKK
jgi:prepilin-type N-terminal cleavage/methylation domain-containing protein